MIREHMVQYSAMVGKRKLFAEYNFIWVHIYHKRKICCHLVFHRKMRVGKLMKASSMEKTKTRKQLKNIISRMMYTADVRGNSLFQQHYLFLKVVRRRPLKLNT
ncbi:hypothetical protein Tb927.6.240 [Trypanosoma brucei brucei TREU927]|uniref:Uncharacterized protein n=1 Tax=Trypanosoma brucei brucei (strain 927/4 GUTat10.1) TaxID=185431 RepID=Q581D8_TRYB2|nr:hypothetical protein Tb927.6.240 [Trypanosoma brucei brucei TREU927]AAX79605.1 hypothetical protein Tb927.6.240 [Trypanosoma brucei]AAZ11594.1 hypothetical protein Tb927.6.240 [Trypanosoma brucei brucei TREU927]